MYNSQNTMHIIDSRTVLPINSLAESDAISVIHYDCDLSTLASTNNCGLINATDVNQGSCWVWLVEVPV